MVDANREFIVGDEEHRLRIDRFLLKVCPEIGRHEIERLVRRGDVHVGGRPRGIGYFLKRGQRVELHPAQSPAADEPLLLQETPQLLAVGKPPGMPTNPVSGAGPSLIEWLQRKDRPAPLPGRPGIVHRLDRETSGVVLFSLSPAAHRSLSDAFGRGDIKKRYLALIAGEIRPKAGTIDRPLSRSTSGRVRIDRSGKKARTDYRTIESNGRLSLLELDPKTGRTHQIRVHLAGLGHPILGDALYGDPRGLEKQTRLWLHAASLVLPEALTQELSGPTRFECPLWTDLVDHLVRLGMGDYGTRNR